MRMRSYRTMGLVRIFVSLAAALFVQFLGGGLMQVVDAHETSFGPAGGGGGFAISMLLRPRWTVAIPLALGVAAVVCLFIGAHEKSGR